MSPSIEERVEGAAAEYLRAVDSGAPPDRAEFLTRYPDLADELGEFLNDLAQFGIGRTPREAPTPQRNPDSTYTFGSNSAATTTLIPLSLPDYEVLEEIARGGMGVVYKARHIRLNRLVAVKVIRAGEFADAGEIKRFRTEAESAANLDHPNIVPIYEVGEHAGQQYYAMRLIEGGSLSERMAEFAVPGAKSRSDSRKRQVTAAGLIATIARAVHHAHQRKTLHRDLKPANILLDPDGTPHVTDFGLARRIGKDSTLTKTGAIIGTPSYMAPEQARGREDVTTEADVYGLGAVLYHLLTGRPPFQGEDVLDTIYQVREREPARPRSVCKEVDRDLETVCLMCLEKDPANRYQSAAALADDIERWLNGEEVLARRASSVERMVKWARRNPAGAGLMGLGTVAAVAIVWVLVALSYNAELAEKKQLVEEANEELTQAKAGLEVSNEKLDEALGRATQERNEADRLRGLADDLRQKAEREERAARALLYVNTVVRIDAAIREGRRGLAESLLADLRPEKFGGKEFRGFEWHHLTRRIGNMIVYEAGGSEATGLRLSEDGERVAGLVSEANKKQGGPPTVLASKVFNADTRVLLKDWGTGTSPLVVGMPGGSRPYMTFDGSMSIYPGEKFGRFPTLAPPGPPQAGTFSPDWSRLAAVCEVGGSQALAVWDVTMEKPALAVWDVTMEKPAFTIPLPDREQRSTTICYSADGTQLYWARRLWEARTGKLTTDLPTISGPASVEVSTAHPTGNLIVLGTADDRVEARRVPTLELVGSWTGIRATALAPIPGSSLLIAGCKDGKVRLLDVATGRTRPYYLQFADPVTGVAYRPRDGAILATDGRQVRVLHPEEVGDGLAIREAGSGSRGPMIDFRSNDEAVVPFSAEGVRAWDVRNGQLVRTYLAAKGAIAIDVAASRDGKWLAAGLHGGMAQVWNPRAVHQLPGLQKKALKGAISSSHRVTFSPDSRYLAIAEMRNVGVYDLTTGQFAHVITHPAPKDSSSWASCFAFTHDSAELVIGWRPYNAGAAVTRQSLATGQQTGIFYPHKQNIHAILNFRDGRLLTASAQGDIKLWDRDWKELYAFVGHRGSVNGAAISPDERRLATSGSDGTVRLWDVETGLELLVLGKHDKSGMGVAFSENGVRIASTGSDGALLVWSSAPSAHPEQGPAPRLVNK